MKHKLLSTFSLLIATLAGGAAHAALITANDGVYGVGSLTQDTSTGLEWLSLPLSAGTSINDVLAGEGGYLANGFQVANLTQVETLFTDGGWDGVDDSASALGSAGHLPFVTQMQLLLGKTSSTFNEGFAQSGLANLASRPFLDITAGGASGRVACTTKGFNTFVAPVNDFASCRMDYDQEFSYIGVYLERKTASVPEPVTLGLLAFGFAGIGFARRKRNG